MSVASLVRLSRGLMSPAMLRVRRPVKRYGPVPVSVLAETDVMKHCGASLMKQLTASTTVLCRSVRRAAMCHPNMVLGMERVLGPGAVAVKRTPQGKSVATPPVSMNAEARALHPPNLPEDTVRSELVTGQGNSSDSLLQLYLSCNVQNAVKFNAVIINYAAILVCSCMEFYTMILFNETTGCVGNVQVRCRGGCRCGEGH